MWIIYALGSAFFAGLTTIFAKMGIKNTDSNVATAIRTIIVVIFSWLMVAIVGSFNEITSISSNTLLFLVLSGLATGASWLFYFKALQVGNVNKVVAVDKSAIVLTIILSFIFFQEPVNVIKIIGMIFITAGTYLMVQKKETNNKETNNNWFFYAVMSVVFASLTTILGKLGISGVESNLGSAIRTTVVLVMAWFVVFVTKKQNQLASISKSEYFYICLSGLATGGSWLCFYHALKIGPASLVVPIDKLSILVTVVASYFIFDEKISKKALFGLLAIVAGTLIMLI